MPLKSKAQRRKFAELLLKGKITEEAFERWNKETGSAELPERVGDLRRKRAKKTTRKKRTSRAKRTKRPRAKTKRTTGAKTKRTTGAKTKRATPRRR